MRRVRKFIAPVFAPVLAPAALLAGLTLAGLIIVCALAHVSIWRAFTRGKPFRHTRFWPIVFAGAIRGVFALFLFVRCKYHSRVQPVRAGECRIVALNHNSTMLEALSGWWFTRCVSRQPLIIAKMELSRTLLGKAMEEIGIAVFIDRNDREQSLAAIREAVARVRRQGGGAIWIHPDQRRPTPERIAADRERYGVGWLQHTKFFKDGGLDTLVDAIGGEVRVDFAVCGLDVEEWKWWHIIRYPFSVFHVSVFQPRLKAGDTAGNREVVLAMCKEAQLVLGRWKTWGKA